MSFTPVGTLCSEGIKDTPSYAGVGHWITTVALHRELQVGQLGVVVIAQDSSGHANKDTYNIRCLMDSVGNEWRSARMATVSSGGASGDGVDCGVFWTIARRQLPTDGFIRVHFAGYVAGLQSRAIVGYVYDVSEDFCRVVATTRRFDAAADAGSLSLTVAVGDLVIRGIGREQSVTTFTPTSGWTSMGSVASPGTTTAAVGAMGEFKIATSTSETSDPSTSVADHASVLVALRGISKSNIVVPHTAPILTPALLGANNKIFGYHFEAAGVTNTNTWESFVPTFGRLLVAFVHNTVSSGTPNIPTITWNGLSFTYVGTVTTGFRRITILTARFTNSCLTAAVANVSCASQSQLNLSGVIHEFENAGGIVASNIQAAVAATVTMNPLAAASNCIVGVGAKQGSTGAVSIAPLQDVLEIGFANNKNGATDYTMATYWRPDAGDLIMGANGALAMGIEIAFGSDITPTSNCGGSSKRLSRDSLSGDFAQRINRYGYR